MRKYIVPTIAFAVGVLGLAGLPDDIKTWAEWIGMIDHAALWYGLLGVSLAAAMSMAVWDWRRARVDHFDIPIRDAIRHVIHTTPHSYQTAQMATDHYFEVLYDKMCSGEIGVAGRKGEDGKLNPIKKRECKRHRPSPAVVPPNPSAPEGVRYCLVARTRPLTLSPLQDAPFDGFTDLRVRSQDLYKHWPKTQST